MKIVMLKLASGTVDGSVATADAFTPNALCIDLSPLGREDGGVATGEPLMCVTCGAAFNCVTSAATREQPVVWECEFCGTVTSLREGEELEDARARGNVSNFMVSSPQVTTTETKTSSLESTLVVICMDVSGSMGETKSRGRMCTSKYEDSVSLLLKAFKKVAKYAPETKIAVVLFNDSVRIVGTSSSASGAILTNEEALVSLGASQHAAVTSKVAVEVLRDALESVTPDGTTALGSALAVAFGIAQAEACTHTNIILATDGDSNLGLGASASEVFWKKAADNAAARGYSVSLLSIQGHPCNVEHVGVAVDATNGIIAIVDPSTRAAARSLERMLRKKPIATNVSITLLLPKDCTAEYGDPTSRGNVIKKHVGNVDRDTALHVPFFAAARIGEPGTLLPLQLQVNFLTTGDKTRMLKIFSLTVPLGGPGETCTNLAVLGRTAIWKVGSLARSGMYGLALAYADEAKRFLSRYLTGRDANPVLVRSILEHLQVLEGSIAKSRNAESVAAVARVHTPPPPPCIPPPFLQTLTPCIPPPQFQTLPTFLVPPSRPSPIFPFPAASASSAASQAPAARALSPPPQLGGGHFPIFASPPPSVAPSSAASRSAVSARPPSPPPGIRASARTSDDVLASALHAATGFSKTRLNGSTSPPPEPGWDDRRDRFSGYHSSEADSSSEEETKNADT